MRVARSRELVAQGRPVAVVARVAGISRQAIYKVPKTPPKTARRKALPVDEVEQAIIDEAEGNPTDGYRMITAFVRRKLGRPVNRKRVLRVTASKRPTMHPLTRVRGS